MIRTLPTSQRYRSLAAATVLVLSISPFYANAQTSDSVQEGEGPLEEIIVTARSRSESLSSIPLSISAFTSDDVRDLGLTDLGDLARLTTGVQFQPRASSGIGGRFGSDVRIRGVAGLGGRTPVSLFVDGVYALGGASVIPLNDLARVEIIKGPQSAFFGRNTFAGAINYVTQNPSLDEFTTQIDAIAGSREEFDVSLLASGPILNDVLGLSINLRNYSRGPQFKATDGGGLGEESSKSGSIVLYGEPTDRFSIKVRGYYQEDDDGPGAAAYFQAGLIAPTCLGREIPGLDDNGMPTTLTLGRFWCGQVPEPGEMYAPTVSTNTSLRPGSFFQVRRAYDARSGILLPAEARPDFLIENAIEKKHIPGVPTLDRMGIRRNILRTSLSMNYDLPSDHQISFTAGYNEIEMNNLFDFDRTDNEAWYSSDPQKGKDSSFDLRISSPERERFRWLAGATYYDQEFVTAGAGGILVSGCVSGFPGFPAPGVCDEASGGIGPVITTTPLTGGDVAEVWGLYGSISFDLTEKITVDIEGRYMDDQRTNTIQAGTFSQDFATTYTQWTPRFIVSYDATDSSMVYLQLARGGLPGALNGNVAICSDQEFTTPYISLVTGEPSTASECDQLASQLPGGNLITSTDSQELNTIELGWKQRSLSSRLNTSIAAYFYEWENLPSQQRITFFRDASNPDLRDGVPNPFPNTLGVDVSGSQKLYGLEFEGTFLLTSKLEVLLNGSWNANEWTEFKSSTAPYYPSSNLKGKERALYPEWLGTVIGTYTEDFNGVWEWYSRVIANYTGRQWIDLPNLAYLNDYWITDLSLGFKRSDLRIEFFVHNLFDEDSWMNGQRGIDFATVGDWAFQNQGIGLVPQDRRSAGLRLNYSFH